MTWTAPEFPKWPEMRVAGEKVTPDQAREIIIRTDLASIYPSSNDDEWCAIIRAVLNIPERPKIIKGDKADDKKFTDYQEEYEAYKESIGWLEGIQYIEPSRITGAYMGGSHGWIDWDGTVGTSGHNIGKWPTPEQVLESWQVIAKAFPFLSLKCQIFNQEQCETERPPVALVEYVIKDGSVVMQEPTDIIPSVPEKPIDYSSIFKPGAERYCSLKTLTEAVAFVKKKIKSEREVNAKSN